MQFASCSVSCPGVVHLLDTSRQMEQINGLELISGVELTFGSFWLQLSIWSLRRDRCKWEFWSDSLYTLCSHSAKLCKTDRMMLHSADGWWLETYCQSSSFLSRPSQSPDLHPAEQLFCCWRQQDLTKHLQDFRQPLIVKDLCPSIKTTVIFVLVSSNSLLSLWKWKYKTAVIHKW